MRRRDAAIAVLAGLALIALIVIVIPTPFGRTVIEGILERWYLGALLVGVSVALGWRGRWDAASRIVGMIGVTWLTMAVGYEVLVVIVFVLFRPMV